MTTSAADLIIGFSCGASLHQSCLSHFCIAEERDFDIQLLLWLDVMKTELYCVFYCRPDHISCLFFKGFSNLNLLYLNSNMLKKLIFMRHRLHWPFRLPSPELDLSCLPSTHCCLVLLHRIKSAAAIQCMTFELERWELIPEAAQIRFDYRLHKWRQRFCCTTVCSVCLPHHLPLFFFFFAENGCSRASSGSQGSSGIQWDSHHPCFHGSGRRCAGSGHSCGLFQALFSSCGQWQAWFGSRGRSRNPLWLPGKVANNSLNIYKALDTQV